jgi:hypothetical protein
MCRRSVWSACNNDGGMFGSCHPRVWQAWMLCYMSCTMMQARRPCTNGTCWARQALGPLTIARTSQSGGRAQPPAPARTRTRCCGRRHQPLRCTTPQTRPRCRRAATGSPRPVRDKDTLMQRPSNSCLLRVIQLDEEQGHAAAAAGRGMIGLHQGAHKSCDHRLSATGLFRTRQQNYKSDNPREEGRHCCIGRQVGWHSRTITTCPRAAPSSVPATW